MPTLRFAHSNRMLFRQLSTTVFESQLGFCLRNLLLCSSYYCYCYATVHMTVHRTGSALMSYTYCYCIWFPDATVAYIHEFARDHACHNFHTWPCDKFLIMWKTPHHDCDKFLIMIVINSTLCDCQLLIGWGLRHWTIKERDRQEVGGGGGTTERVNNPIEASWGFCRRVWHFVIWRLEKA